MNQFMKSCSGMLKMSVMFLCCLSVVICLSEW